MVLLNPTRCNPGSVSVFELLIMLPILRLVVRGRVGVCVCAKPVNANNNAAAAKVPPRLAADPGRSMAALRRFYAPYNRALYAIAGKDFGWPGTRAGHLAR